MMQWSNLTKCDLFVNIVSHAVHTLLLSVLQRLDSRGIEALILILEKRSSTADYDLIIGRIYCFSAKCFSCWGTENSQMVPSQENVEGDQPVQSHSHAQQPLQPQTCVQEHCPGETGLPLLVFQAVHKMSLVLLFKVLTYLSIQCGFIWKTLQFISGKVEVCACQVSLLWLNSFLLSLIDELFSPPSHLYYLV